MSLQQAINAPRLSVTSPAGTIACEGVEAFMQPRFSIATQDSLRTLGHLGLGAAGSNACTAAIGSVQGVVMDLRTGRRYGGADLRREGSVIGEKHHPAHGLSGPDDDAQQEAAGLPLPTP
jgi:gamma-glutamyltranspeptidase/glutathione hydrolase